MQEPDMPIEALKVLPNKTNDNWLRDRGLRKLNAGIGFMFASSAGTGYNGSLINGLLVLPECKMSDDPASALRPKRSDTKWLLSFFEQFL